MTTTIRCHTAFPFPARRAWMLLADPAVIEGRTAGHDGLGAVVLAHEVAAQADRGFVRIETQGTMPTSWLPSVLSGRAAGRMPTVHRTETWHRTREDRLDGRMAFTIRGVDAASAQGSMRLQPGTEGSDLHQEITIAVAWPLLGALIERSIAARIHASLAAEAGYLAQQ